MHHLNSKRKFRENLFSSLTKTPWWAVPLFWIPTIMYIANIGLNEANVEGFSSVSTIFNIIDHFVHFIMLRISSVNYVLVSLVAYSYGQFWSIRYTDGCFT